MSQEQSPFHTGELAIQEAPAVYSVQVLGFVLFLEINRGLRA